MRELNLATEQGEVGGGRNGQPDQERFVTITIIAGSHSSADIQNQSFLQSAGLQK
jgi:hypothetical protein